MPSESSPGENRDQPSGVEPAQKKTAVNPCSRVEAVTCDSVGVGFSEPG